MRIEQPQNVLQESPQALINNMPMESMTIILGLTVVISGVVLLILKCLGTTIDIKMIKGFETLPNYMSQDVIDKLRDPNQEIKLKIFLHNKPQELSKDGNTWTYINWKNDTGNVICGDLHIYPSEMAYNQGLFENSLLTTLTEPSSGLPSLPAGVFTDDKAAEIMTYMANKVKIDPILTCSDRIGAKLYLYIDHLFGHSNTWNWAAPTTISESLRVVDLRGLVFEKVNDNVVLKSAGTYDIDFLPEKLNAFMAVLNDIWEPILTIF